MIIGKITGQRVSFLDFKTLSSLVSCRALKLHNGSSESPVTRGLSPLPLCVLDNEQLKIIWH